MGRVIIFDTECNNFFPQLDKMWVIILKSVCGTVNTKLYPHSDPDAANKLMALIVDGDTLVGHNIVGYDFFAIMKTMGIYFHMGSQTLELDGKLKAIRVVDTLCLSRFLNPDQRAHSLEWYGKNKFNFPKIDFHEFDKFSDEMVVYCERDVDLNILVYLNLIAQFEKVYGELTSPAFENYQYDYYLMCCQGLTGVLFDYEKAIKVRTNLAHDLTELRDRVEPQLPPRPMNKGEQKDYRMPKKPFKKDGSVGASTYNFIEKMRTLGHRCFLLHGEDYIDRPVEYIVRFNGDNYPLISQFILPRMVPMTMSNQGDMKTWLQRDCGWKPTLWNWEKIKVNDKVQFKRDNRGQLIPTTPKMQEQGKICENLAALADTLPIVKDTCKFLSLRNRHSVISTWIANERLDIDGRLSSRSSGTTPTYRHKHAEVVNVPKAQEGVLYGKEFRSLFCAPPGRKFVGGDASGLEARVDGHYCAKTDGGERADIILNGDIHSRNAKLFFPKETAAFDIDAPDFDKDHPGFKPYRSRSKNAAYALAYGCGVKKLAATLGKPEKEAQSLYDAFWNGNPALKAVKVACLLYWKSKKMGNRKFLSGIDGRMITTRKESALVNSLFQSCGAIIMSYAAVFMDKWLGGIKWDRNYRPYYEYKGCVAKRVLFNHDEFQYECDDAIADEIGQMIVDAIVKAGEFLNLRLPLDGDYGIGENWSLTH